MRTIALVISYEGTNYTGYQSQPAKTSVQDQLEAAIYSLTGEKVKAHGSGRTDAGVHARGQVVHFHTASRIPIERWCLALNSRLPGDIRVLQAHEVPAQFHARRSARFKTYRYAINNSKHEDVFQRRIELHVPRPLDVEAMEAGLRHLVGTHDFTAFSSSRSDRKNKVRTIVETRLDTVPYRDGRRIYIYIKGNGFLYNMVRIIVGTLLLVGQGKLQPDDVKRILQSRQRQAAGPTAEPHGLMLWNVEYDDLPGETFS